MQDSMIRKYALQNAVKFKGTASPGAVIGRIIAEKPQLKAKIKEIARKVNSVIGEINSLTLEEQISLLKKEAPELLKEKKHEERERALPALKKPGKPVMRFEPSPSGPLHIGHAYVLSLNSEYCRKYRGKLILRIGDTNPENIYAPAYEMIEEDAGWVTDGNINQVVIQSGRLETYYRYMVQLIGLGKAYVCKCDPERYKQLIIKQKACPCRNLPKEEQLERWKKMFNGYKQGEAVARIKTELNNKNPAMRDFPAFRINDSKHTKTGKRYRVWPLMNMAVAVDDIELKVTHVVRAKEHHDNAIRQRYIYNYLGKDFPEAIFVGRINFEGMPVSCSKTRPLIENRTYTGWDDIRLPFLAALRRRGYQPEAFVRYAIDVGISLNDKTVTKEEFFKTIDAFNKDIIDGRSHRHFFVQDPKEITIGNSPAQDVELDLHPENRKGGRRFKTGDRFYVSGDDFNSFTEGKLYRLMDCLNFTMEEGRFIFHSLDYKEYREKGEKIIHWLPKEKGMAKVEVLMPDNKVVKGFGENGLGGLKEGDVIQFTRFGFCRLDRKGKNKLVFWYAHD
ncbi:glutamate--tRNA ligase [Candidatus Woesearchaeota archaeon]|nr:glutamate--tRNA ligase [Candidatus Woesearchaeota archaeon]